MIMTDAEAGITTVLSVANCNYGYFTTAATCFFLRRCAFSACAA